MREFPKFTAGWRHYVYPGGREALSYIPFANDPTPPFFGWLERTTDFAKTFIDNTTFSKGSVRINVSLMRRSGLIWMQVIQGDPKNPTFTSQGPNTPPLPYYSMQLDELKGKGAEMKKRSRRRKEVRGGRNDKTNNSSSRTAKPEGEGIVNDGKDGMIRHNRKHPGSKRKSSGVYKFPLALICPELLNVRKENAKEVNAYEDLSCKNRRRKRGPRSVFISEGNEKICAVGKSEDSAVRVN